MRNLVPVTPRRTLTAAVKVRPGKGIDVLQVDVGQRRSQICDPGPNFSGIVLRLVGHS